ncbi:MAG: rhomboid family intramembrane serine protease [Patescibacteria group bacterium]|nr:rhomboid family intramembrane serine protease [Patescibacteria group bacterium]
MFFIPYGTAEPAPRRSFPYVNVFLVIVNVLVFLIELYLLGMFGPDRFESFINQHAFVPAHLGAGVLQLTLLTSLFLHAGFLHVIGNMMYLLPFGDNVEDRMGHVRYLLFYVICGVGASLIYALFNQGSPVPLIGASGAIAGVLGGYLALYPRGAKVKGFFWVIILLIPIRLPAVLFIGYWFLMQIFSSVATLTGNVAAQSSGVAFLAHVGGFALGFVLAPLFARPVHVNQENALI